VKQSHMCGEPTNQPTYNTSVPLPLECYVCVKCNTYSAPPLPSSKGADCMTATTALIYALYNHFIGNSVRFHNIYIINAWTTLIVTGVYQASLHVHTQCTCTCICTFVAWCAKLQRHRRHNKHSNQPSE
jgi:hypothetical protein